MANTAAKKITYDGKPVQVESAIRDGTGLQINTTYVRHAEFSITTTATTTSGNVMISDLGLGGKTPRIVQIFDDSGNEVGGDVTVSSTQVTYTLIGTVAGQTWKCYITAW